MDRRAEVGGDRDGNLVLDEQPGIGPLTGHVHQLGHRQQHGDRVGATDITDLTGAACT